MSITLFLGSERKRRGVWQDGKEERRDKDGKKDKEGNKEKVERPRRRLQRQNSIDLGLQPPPSVLTGNSLSSSLSLSIHTFFSAIFMDSLSMLHLSFEFACLLRF